MILKYYKTIYFLIIFLLSLFIYQVALAQTVIDPNGDLNLTAGKYYQFYNSDLNDVPVNGFNSNACIEFGGGLDCSTIQGFDGILINLVATPNLTLMQTSGFLACFGLVKNDCSALAESVDLWPVPVIPPSSNIWGDNAGIWGEEVTTDDVKNDLVASVQATGSNLWPLLIFVGITLAFIIFLQVVFLTKNTVTPQSTKKEIIDKTLTKRKRGRPRKIPVISVD